jgi:hypothetical protein
VKLTTQLHLFLKLKPSGAVPPPHHMPSWRAQRNFILNVYGSPYWKRRNRSDIELQPLNLLPADSHVPILMVCR